MRCSGSWGHCLGLLAIHFNIQVSSPGRQVLFFSVQITHCVQSILSDLLGNGVEGFRSLGWSWSLSTVQAHTLAPFLCLCCTVLSFSLGTRPRMCVLEECCPTSAQPLLQPQLVQQDNRQQLSVITDNPWLAPRSSNYHCLRHTHCPLIFWDSTVTRTKRNAQPFCLFLVTKDLSLLTEYSGYAPL